jgi:hemerythrin-like domain-containing protein
MRYQFYREHKYVSSSLNDLERLIAKTDFCDRIAVEQVKKAFVELIGMLKGHAEYENGRLHALLRQKNSPSSIYAQVEEDHVAQDEQLLQIEKMIQDIQLEQEDRKKIDKGYLLYLGFRKFVADNLAHLHEEETQILPALQKLYSDQELQQVEAQSYREMTPEQIIQMTEVLFPHMNTYDRQAFLMDIYSLVPEKFDGVWAGVQSIIEEKERLAMGREQNKRKEIER